MARFTFTCEHFDYDVFNGDELGVAVKNTTEFRADELETILESFESFLRGAGYVFDGSVDVVRDEEPESIATNKKAWDWTVKELMKGPITLKDVEDDPNSITITGSSDVNIDFDLNVQGAGAMPTFTIEPLDTISFDLSLAEDDIPRGKCEICGLDKQMMMVHNCYDDNCPIHSPKS